MLPAEVAFAGAKRKRQVVATAAARRVWRDMGPDLEASWQAIGPRMAVIVSAAQRTAARAAVAHVDEMAASIDLDAPVFSIRPDGFAGIATDIDGIVARPLDSLLYGAVVHARETGADHAVRLAAGGRALDMLVWSQVADASRMAAATRIAAHPGAGWVRVVSPPCCKRCAVLAGKWFRSNSGFQRHPLCDCFHRPATGPADGDGVALDDIKDLTKTERAAIDAGADLAQVVNAKRKGSRLPGAATSEGMTTRGWASLVRREVAQAGGLARGARPTAEAILRMADDQAELRRLLAANGYIVDDLPRVAALSR